MAEETKTTVSQEGAPKTVNKAERKTKASAKGVLLRRLTALKANHNPTGAQLRGIATLTKNIGEKEK